MSDLRKKIKEAIKFTGTSPKTSGGWIDQVLDPIVDKLVEIFNQEGGEIMSDTFRKEYTPLSDQQRAEMLAIKEKAEELETLFVKSMQREPRLMAVAKTQLETAVLFAVKAVTTAEVGGAVDPQK